MANYRPSLQSIMTSTATGIGSAIVSIITEKDFATKIATHDPDLLLRVLAVGLSSAALSGGAQGAFAFMANEIYKRTPDRADRVEYDPYNPDLSLSFNVVPSLKASLVEAGVPLLDSYEFYIIRQMTMDFKRNHLRTKETLQGQRFNIQEKAKYFGSGFSCFQQDVDSLLEGFSSFLPLGNPEGTKQAIYNLKNRQSKISISCISIQVAIIATLEYMHKIMKIPLEVNYHTRSGLGQMTSAVESSSQYGGFEYIFASNADFLMSRNSSGMHFPITRHYKYLMPVHYKKQYIIRPYSAAGLEGLEGVEMMIYVPDGCSHEHARAMKDLLNAGRRSIGSPFVDELLLNVPKNKALFLWEHSVEPLVESGTFYRVPRMTYGFWVSLFGLRTSKGISEQDRDFITAFVHAWRECKRNKGLSVALLESARIITTYTETIHLKRYERQSAGL